MSRKMRNRLETKPINRMLQAVINIADFIDAEAEKDMFAKTVDPLTRYTGYGYRALSSYLRDGVKAVVELQDEYSETRFLEKLAHEDAEDVRDFLEECFGDREVDNFNDKDKQRIIDLCNQIKKEWDEDEN